MTLIGWHEDPRRHDGGLPTHVATVLARALTAVARVTFPCSATTPPGPGGWSPSGERLVRGLVTSRLSGRVAAFLKGQSRQVALVSTRDPRTVAAAFDDGEYPWWLQGQALLLSGRDAVPPEIDWEALLALLGERWSTEAVARTDAGLIGVLRPGVDGDVAGLLSLTPDFEESVLAALEPESRLAGVGWAVVTEDECALRL